MMTTKVTLVIFSILCIFILALTMQSEASVSIIRGANNNKAGDSGPFLFARNDQTMTFIYVQVDLNTGSFMKMGSGLLGRGLALDAATRTIFTRHSHGFYKTDVDTLEFTGGGLYIDNVVDHHYDSGFNKLIGIISGPKGSDAYKFVEIDPKNAASKTILEFKGRFEQTAYDPVKHMYYLQSSVEDPGFGFSISQFNMTHGKVQRVYTSPTPLSGMVVDGNTIYGFTQRDYKYYFAKLDLTTGEIVVFKTQMPGRVLSSGAFDPERGIYYGCTRIQEITYQLLEIHVNKNGELTTKQLPASFSAAIFVPPKK